MALSGWPEVFGLLEIKPVAVSGWLEVFGSLEIKPENPKDKEVQ